MMQADWEDRVCESNENSNLSTRQIHVGTCGDVDCDEIVTMNDGRQIFMYLIYGEDQYPLCDPWAANCDGVEGISMNDGRQIFMNLIYGPDDYPLVCD